MRCAKRGCAAVGRWKPVLQLWVDEKRRGKPGQVVIDLVLCDRCRARVGQMERRYQVAQFVDAGGWEHLCGIIKSQGKLKPMRRATKVGWVKVKDPLEERKGKGRS